MFLKFDTANQSKVPTNIEGFLSASVFYNIHLRSTRTFRSRNLVTLRIWQWIGKRRIREFENKTNRKTSLSKSKNYKLTKIILHTLKKLRTIPQNVFEANCIKVQDLHSTSSSSKYILQRGSLPYHSSSDPGQGLSHSRRAQSAKAGRG